MRVQRVVMPSGAESWTLLGPSGVIEPVERFLVHLSAIERSPNTVRAYAHDLKDCFTFLASRCLAWPRVRLEDIGSFVAWLRLAPAARGGHVSALPWVASSVSANTVNRKLSALASFYEFHHRHGGEFGDLLTSWRPGGRGGSWQPFLAHLGQRPERRRTVKLPAERRAPRSLLEADVDALINGCDRLRDRFLVVLLRASGLRVGEALGLRHEELNARRGEVTVCQRLNANGARAKTWSRVVPVEARVIRLYSDYLHEEYGTLDSDYVFVNLWGSRPGRPLRYASVNGLVQRLRARTGVEFTMHELRHTYATDLLRRGVAAEVVQKLLGHASITTTADTYSHLDVEDARRALVAAGIKLEATS